MQSATASSSTSPAADNKQLSQLLPPKKSLYETLLSAMAAWEAEAMQTAIRNSLKEDEKLIARKSALKTRAKSNGLSCHEVPADGDCFYHALYDQLKRKNLCSSLITSSKQLKELAIQHILDHRDHYKGFMNDMNEFIVEHTLPRTWVDHPLITALSHVLKITIVIIPNAEHIAPSIFKPANFEDTVFLGYEVGLHYQSLVADADFNTKSVTLKRLIDETPVSNIISDAKSNSMTDAKAAPVLVKPSVQQPPELLAICEQLVDENRKLRAQLDKQASDMAAIVKEQKAISGAIAEAQAAAASSPRTPVVLSSPVFPPKGHSPQKSIDIEEIKKERQQFAIGLSNLNLVIEGLRQQVEALTNKKEKKEKTITKLKGSLSEEQRKLATASIEEKKAIQATIDALQDKLKTAEADLQKIQRDLEESQAQVREKERTVNELRANLANKDKELMLRDAKLNLQGQKMDELLSKLTEAEKNEKKAADQLIRAQEQKISALKERDALQKDLKVEAKIIQEPEFSPWFAAAQQGDTKRLESMIKLFQLTNFVDRFGNSALHHAIMREKYELTPFLINQGINPNLVNEEKQASSETPGLQTALGLAISKVLEKNKNISSDLAKKLEFLSQKTALYRPIQTVLDQILTACAKDPESKMQYTPKIENKAALIIFIQCKLIPIITKFPSADTEILREDRNIQKIHLILKQCRDFIKRSFKGKLAKTYGLIGDPVMNIKVDVNQFIAELDAFITEYKAGKINLSGEINLQEYVDNILNEVIGVLNKRIDIINNGKNFIDDATKGQFYAEAKGTFAQIRGGIDSIQSVRGLDNPIRTSLKSVLTEAEESVIELMNRYITCYNPYIKIAQASKEQKEEKNSGPSLLVIATEDQCAIESAAVKKSLKDTIDRLKTKYLPALKEQKGSPLPGSVAQSPRGSVVDGMFRSPRGSVRFEGAGAAAAAANAQAQRPGAAGAAATASPPPPAAKK